LGETVVHLFAGLVDEFRVDFEAEASLAGTERLERGLRLLLDAHLRPAHIAVVELYVLARTDAEIASCVLPAAGAHRMTIFELGKLYYPELTDDPRFVPGLVAILDAMMGMTVMGCVAGLDAIDIEGQFNFLQAMFFDMLAQPYTQVRS
jgi:hypothetical protein